MKIARLFVIGMFLTTVAVGDDVDDVKAAELDLMEAENDGDAVKPSVTGVSH